MADSGESVKGLYDKCCTKAMLESLLASKALMDVSGYRKTSRLVRDSINIYRGKHKWIDGFGDKLVNSLLDDLEGDYYLEGILKHDPDSYEIGTNSMRNTINIIYEITSQLSTSYNAQLGFMRYFSDRITPNEVFDFEKLRMSQNRVKNAGNPQESLPALKDQFSQIFEDVFRPYSKSFTEIISYYPGMNPRKAYELVESLFSVTRCYQYRGEYKSDLREIRNALAHEKYRIGSKLSLILNDGSTIELTVSELLFRISMMSYKCMFISMVLPILNLEVMRGINL